MMRSLRVAPSSQRQFGQSQALASHVKLQGQMAGAAGHPLAQDGDDWVCPVTDARYREADGLLRPVV